MGDKTEVLVLDKPHGEMSEDELLQTERKAWRAETNRTRGTFPI